MNTTHHTHRITLPLLAAVSLLATAALHAQPAPSLEGRVNMTTTAYVGKKATTLNMLYYIKGAKIRFETAPPADTTTPAPDDQKAAAATAQLQSLFNFASIVDPDAQKIYILIPSQKMYYEHPLTDQKTQKTKTGETDFKPTGRTDTIAGRSAAEYANTTSKGTYSEIWVTKDLGSFRMTTAGPGGKIADQTAWQKYLADNNLFPLRVLQYDKKGGKLISQLDVTQIEQTPQPDDLFTLPPDYKKFSIGAAAGGLLKGLGGALGKKLGGD